MHNTRTMLITWKHGQAFTLNNYVYYSSTRKYCCKIIQEKFDALLKMLVGVMCIVYQHEISLCYEKQL